MQLCTNVHNNVSSARISKKVEGGGIGIAKESFFTAYPHSRGGGTLAEL